MTALLSLDTGCYSTTSISAVHRFVQYFYFLQKTKPPILFFCTACLTIFQVLDRLNALFEPGGELVISERGLDSDGLFPLVCDFSVQTSFFFTGLTKHLGQICTIRPHPNFRAFMAMNSVSGEVSQPMRNRGIEISILSSEFSRADAVSSPPHGVAIVLFCF